MMIAINQLALRPSNCMGCCTQSLMKMRTHRMTRGAQIHSMILQYNRLTSIMKSMDRRGIPSTRRKE